jgi:hypothetical protein
MSEEVRLTDHEIIVTVPAASAALVLARVISIAARFNQVELPLSRSSASPAPPPIPQPHSERRLGVHRGDC